MLLSVARTVALILTASIVVARCEELSSLTHGGPVRSIKEWTTCDGRHDDREGVSRAFSEAQNNAFVLLVDCPVFVHVGVDVSRPIFIQNGVSVGFSGEGLFIVDNVFMPTWVIANSSHISLTNWRVRYVGSLPVDPDTKGFLRKGSFFARKGKFQPAAAFNDLTLTPWLTQHRGIVFDQSQGLVTSPWVGPTGTSSVFYIVGNSSFITIRGMKMSVPAGADGSRFIPSCFLAAAGFNNNQRVTASTPQDGTAASIPSDIVVSDLELDGTYMGWVGALRDSQFLNVRSYRYGDLQDVDGQNVGGVGKWFAPPHLFYLTLSKSGDLQSRNIKISDVVDYGKRVGVARDRDASSRTGYALSLKIAANSSLVKNYISYRPDGFLDVLKSENLTISGLKGTYDSSFLNELFPGIRFPMGGYKNVILDDLRIEDLARNTKVAPIGSVLDSGSNHIVLRNVVVRLRSPDRSALSRPSFSGVGSSVDIKIIVE